MQKQVLNFRWDTGAVSPIIGVILMVFLTILLAGITVSSVYGGGAVSSLSKAPMALIEVEYVEGGVQNYPTYVQYKENFLYMEHMGGDSLETASTMILISGEGSSYEGVVPHGTRHYGEVFINYDSLMFEGKKSVYASRNPDISDGVWSAGEKLILNGDDAINGSASSTVSVSINGITNTANHYGLKEGSMVTIKIFDSESKCIISEFECVVTPVD